MTDLGPYARIYQCVVDDPKFEDIFDNDAHWACYTRLLMLAEQAWPQSAYIPASARRASVRLLAERTIIDLVGGGRFRIHGLDAERQRRSERSQKAADNRWNRPTEDVQPSAGDDPLVAYSSLIGSHPTQKAIKWLDEIAAKYGAKALTKALGQAAKDGATTGKLIGEAQAVLVGWEREAAQREKDAEKAKRDSRRDAGVWQRRVEAYRASGGKVWDKEWGEPPGLAA
jgi:hypothetical protein